MYVCNSQKKTQQSVMHVISPSPLPRSSPAHWARGGGVLRGGGRMHVKVGEEEGSKL